MIIVYSKNQCTSCEVAKQLLIINNYEHEVRLLNVDFDILQLYSVAPKTHRSFPCITKLVGDKEEYIGGLKELEVYIEKGGL